MLSIVASGLSGISSINQMNNNWSTYLCVCTYRELFLVHFDMVMYVISVYDAPIRYEMYCNSVFVIKTYSLGMCFFFGRQFNMCVIIYYCVIALKL
jgi:hypothetical protein